VDDEPAPVAEWLPIAAEAVGARAPRHVPRWLGRLFAGEFATVMMTEARGASNAKAKRELAWAPRHASRREGFATGLARWPPLTRARAATVSATYPRWRLPRQPQRTGS
jgi:nucleoside-diphosphate-sugar epimerase